VVKNGIGVTDEASKPDVERGRLPRRRVISGRQQNHFGSTIQRFPVRNGDFIDGAAPSAHSLPFPRDIFSSSMHGTGPLPSRPGRHRTKVGMLAALTTCRDSLVELHGRNHVHDLKAPDGCRDGLPARDHHHRHRTEMRKAAPVENQCTRPSVATYTPGFPVMAVRCGHKGSGLLPGQHQFNFRISRTDNVRSPPGMLKCGQRLMFRKAIDKIGALDHWQTTPFFNPCEPLSDDRRRLGTPATDGHSCHRAKH
jgi:hypothetical protein